MVDLREGAAILSAAQIYSGEFISETWSYAKSEYHQTKNHGKYQREETGILPE